MFDFKSDQLKDLIKRLNTLSIRDLNNLIINIKTYLKLA